MHDQDQTKAQLLAELEALRQRVAEFETPRALMEGESRPWASRDPHWHSLVANTPVFILILDRDQRICFANHTDSGAASQQLIGKFAYAFCRPDEQASVRERVERIFQTGRPDLYQGPGLRLDAQEHWYAAHLGPIFEDGQVVAVSVIAINVTAGKQAEEAVRQSEQRMRLHVEQTPLAVMEWDLEVRVAKWNPGAVRIFGYSEAEALGRHFSFLVPPEVREHIEQLEAALLAKRGGERSTNENITKAGQRILCEWYNTPLINAEGQVIGIASLAEDITERKRAEAALQESERRLATLMSNLPGMAYRCRNAPNWSMEFVSEGCSRLTGFPAAELLANRGVALREPDPPRGSPNGVGPGPAGLGPTATISLGVPPAHGTREERWVWEQGAGVFSDGGELQALEGLITDMTDRKRAEAALRVSEAKYRRLHQSMMDAFVSVTMDGRIQEFNDAFRHMLGYEAEELAQLTYIDVTPSRWHAIETAIVREQILARGYSDTYEKEYQRKDGTIFPVELRTFLIHDDQGQPAAMWAIVRDITARKRAEADIQQANDRLERRVQERTAELTTGDRRTQARRRHAAPAERLAPASLAGQRP